MMAKIVKRGKVYYVDYRYPPTRQGKRMRVRVGTNKADAVILLGQLEEQRKVGMHPTLGTIKPIPFSEASERFMQEYVKANDRVESPYRIALRPLLLHFGQMPLGAITRGEINRYRTQRLQQPKLKRGEGTVSPSTINREVAFISRLFTWAHDEAEIFAGENPARRMRFEEPKPAEDHYLTQEQADKLILHAAGHVKPVLRFMLEVGSRVGETLLLEWDCIDMNPGQEAVTFKAENTKAGVGRRVPLTGEAVAVLREVGKVRHTSHNRVFTFRGQPIRKIKSVQKAARRAGLPSWVTPHVTRHSAATWARQSGIDLSLLQAVLGHADVRQTMRYAKATPEYLRQSVAYMGRRGQAVDKKTGSGTSNAAS
jgi:integrase